MMANYSVTRRLELFPVTAQYAGPGDQRLSFAGCDVGELAARYGTPLYFYDQRTMDQAADEYRNALQGHYPGNAGITYAGKAFLCTAMAQWVAQQDLWLDCTGVGELRFAEAAGADRTRIVVHGVNKSHVDRAAASTQAGIVVVDNLEELDWWLRCEPQPSEDQPVLWLRIRPGQRVDTHVYTQTGQTDSKFGMSPQEIVEAVTKCRRHGLSPSGLHFHMGSHFRDASPLSAAIDTMLDVVLHLRAECDWLPDVVSPGGGWGVAYHEDDLPQPSIEAYVQSVAGHLAKGCQRRELPLPRLQLEPGRSLVARAGVAVYQVGAVKHTAHRRWLLLDGGLADNPRPALYGVRYTALPVSHPQRDASGLAWLAGPYCESGDVLIEGLALPEIETGEFVAVPVSGAYQLSMGSNYNGARRPAVLWLCGGTAHLVQRREELDDLVRRDLPLDLRIEKGMPSQSA